jgi:hypothetical protein
MLMDAAIPKDRTVIKKETEKILKYRPHNINSAHVERESKSGTGNNRGDWNRFKSTQTIPEQHIGRARIIIIIIIRYGCLLSQAFSSWYFS